MVAMTAGLAAVAGVLLLPLLLDLLALLRRPRPTLRSTRSPTPRLLFLVPAHNEELLIGACVDSLKALRYPAGRFDIVVIADNCDDRTAELARASGAACLERHGPGLRGKPA